MIRSLVICIVLSILSVKLYSQSFNYQHFDVDDGLPSSQVFCAFQDMDGYMWFTTDNGLSRYDGYSFQNFSNKDGIIDNTILSGTVAKDSSILFFTLSSGFLWYKNGQFQPIKSKKYNELINKQSLKIKNYVLDEHKTIWFSTNENWIYYSIDTGGRLTKFRCETLGRYKVMDGTFLVTIDEDNILPVFNNGRKREDLLKNFVSNSITHLYIPSTHIKEAVKNKEDFILFPKKETSKSQRVLVFSPKEKTYTVLAKTDKYNWFFNALLLDDLGNRWMASESGVLIYNSYNKEQEPITLLNRVFITSLYQDFEKNIWITSNDNGAYLITGKKVKSYLDNKKIISLSKYNNQLWVTTVSGEVFKFNKRSQFVKVFDKNSKNEVFASHISKNRIFFYDGVYDFSGKRKHTPKTNINAKEVIKLGDSAYLIGTHNGVTYFSYKKNFLGGNMGVKLRTNSLLVDTANNILLGTVKGLFSFNINDDTYTDLREGKKLLSERIMDIEKWGRRYVLATKGVGLVVYGNDTLYSINKEHGLKSDLISCITVTNDSVIWIGSNSGVARIEFYAKTQRIKKVSNYTHIEGIAANEVTDIITLGDSIWVATSKGVSLIPIKSDTKFTITPKLSITEVRINNQLKKVKSYFELKPHENNIFINYSGISFKTLGNVTFRYRLKGYIDKWTETKSKNANFTNIPAGSYIFELQAKNKNDLWSDSKAVSFTIAKHFTQTVWFIVLIIFVIVSIPSIIIFIYFKNRRAQERQKRKALESELFALRTQVNPHFIFNALNSIQAYNVKARDRDAIQYLSNFSELMRQILENTKHSFISLYDEINCVTNYLKLESLRTNKRFTYTIEIDDALKALHVYIPPMLIQPHLENAIWKGFTSEVNNPHIKILFSKQNETLTIKIRDNGIGITKGKNTIAKAIQINGYKSTGIRNILNRLESIKQLYDIDITLSIADLSENDDEQIGIEQTGTEITYSITLLKKLPKSI